MIRENRLNLFDWSTILFAGFLGFLSIIKLPVMEILKINFFTLFGILSILFLVKHSHNSKIALHFRRFYIVPLLPLFFSFLHYLVPRIHTDFFDLILIDIDYFLFKTHPVLLIQDLHHPLLSAVCQIAYSTFYFLPFPMAIYYLKRKDMSSFYHYGFVIVTSFYISYLGYFVFPSVGPRIFLQDLMLEQSHSDLVTSLQHTLNTLENVQFDAFPSGHTLITLLIIFFHFHERVKFRYVILILGIFLILATIYFQYHYVIDVIAGAVLAIMLYYLFKPLKIYFED